MALPPRDPRTRRRRERALARGASSSHGCPVFTPWRPRSHRLRREVRFHMRCEPRFDDARATHTAERRSDTELLFVGR